MYEWDFHAASLWSVQSDSWFKSVILVLEEEEWEKGEGVVSWRNPAFKRDNAEMITFGLYVVYLSTVIWFHLDFEACR